MTQAPLTLHLVSSLDETRRRLATALGVRSGWRLLIVDTARRAEGRTFAADELLPFQDEGATCTLADLSGSSPSEAAKLVAQADAILLLGGNTFALMAALIKANFATAVRARCQDASRPLAVIGESAGAVVMGLSIVHVATMDDPGIVPNPPEDGLGWLNARVLPHRFCPHWGFGEKVEALLANDPDPGSLLVLTEGELRSVNLFSEQ